MVTVPIVNNNGNTRASLVEQAMGIHSALEHVKGLVADSDLCHGRNFQTVADVEIGKAAREELARDYGWLNAKAKEYLELAIAIDQQGK